jgi:hypothetical protein
MPCCRCCPACADVRKLQGMRFPFARCPMMPCGLAAGAVQTCRNVPEADVLRGLLADETQLTHLALGCKGEYKHTLRVAELGSLTALQHLDASAFAGFKGGDRPALRRLQQLTTLKMPYFGWVGPCWLTVL